VFIGSGCVVWGTVAGTALWLGPELW
jgi:hypothetical protein